MARTILGHVTKGHQIQISKLRSENPSLITFGLKEMVNDKVAEILFNIK